MKKWRARCYSPSQNPAWQGCWMLEVHFQHCTEQEAVLWCLWVAVGTKQAGSLAALLELSTRRQVVESFLSKEIVRYLKQESQVLQTRMLYPKKD